MARFAVTNLLIASRPIGPSSLPGWRTGRTVRIRLRGRRRRLLSSRIRLEMLRKPAHGPGRAYRRFERPGPMQLWQIDIVGGIRLADPVTGELCAWHWHDPLPGVLVPMRPASATALFLRQGNCRLPATRAAVVRPAPLEPVRLRRAHPHGCDRMPLARRAAWVRSAAWSLSRMREA